MREERLLSAEIDDDDDDNDVDGNDDDHHTWFDHKFNINIL